MLSLISSRSLPGKLAYDLSVLLAQKGALIKSLTKQGKEKLSREEIAKLAAITKIIHEAAERLHGVR